MFHSITEQTTTGSTSAKARIEIIVIGRASLDIYWEFGFMTTRYKEREPGLFLFVSAASPTRC